MSAIRLTGPQRDVLDSIRVLQHATAEELAEHTGRSAARVVQTLYALHRHALVCRVSTRAGSAWAVPATRWHDQRVADYRTAMAGRPLGDARLREIRAWAAGVGLPLPEAPRAR